jgi:sugar phosphate isomerase/epimerase
MKDAGLNDVELILWPSAIMHLPLATQLDVAAAGQFDGIAIAPVTIKRELATGLSIADLLSQANDRGISLAYLDGVSTWTHPWYPTVGDPVFNANIRARFDIAIEEALDLGEALGIPSAVAVGAFDEGTVPLDRLVDCYANFCDAAKAHRIDVHLEFIPLWGIRELPMAWEIVETADRVNSGIVVDTWHLQQGSSDFERDLSLLETIPGRYLRDVQLADATLIEAGHSLMDEIMLRKFPGDGVLDISRMLSLVAKAGGLRSVGPEVVGVALDGLSLEQIGDRSGATTRGAISRARNIAQ